MRILIAIIATFSILALILSKEDKASITKADQAHDYKVQLSKVSQNQSIVKTREYLGWLIGQRGRWTLHSIPACSKEGSGEEKIDVTKLFKII